MQQCVPSPGHSLGQQCSIQVTGVVLCLSPDLGNEGALGAGDERLQTDLLRGDCSTVWRSTATSSLMCGKVTLSGPQCYIPGFCSRKAVVKRAAIHCNIPGSAVEQPLMSL